MIKPNAASQDLNTRIGVQNALDVHAQRKPIQQLWSQIAFLTCPSMYLTASSLLREPHGCRPVASYAGVGYGNGQADWGFVGANPDVFHYDRNYLYGDGHVAYLTSPRRAGLPP